LRFRIVATNTFFLLLNQQLPIRPSSRF